MHAHAVWNSSPMECNPKVPFDAALPLRRPARARALRKWPAAISGPRAEDGVLDRRWLEWDMSLWLVVLNLNKHASAGFKKVLWLVDDLNQFQLLSKGCPPSAESSMGDLVTVTGRPYNATPQKIASLYQDHLDHPVWVLGVQPAWRIVCWIPPWPGPADPPTRTIRPFWVSCLEIPI